MAVYLGSWNSASRVGPRSGVNRSPASQQSASTTDEAVNAKASPRQIGEPSVARIHNATDRSNLRGKYRLRGLSMRELRSDQPGGPRATTRRIGSRHDVVTSRRPR